MIFLTNGFGTGFLLAQLGNDFGRWVHYVVEKSGGLAGVRRAKENKNFIKPSQITEFRIA
jgi:hypothetical protein